MDAEEAAFFLDRFLAALVIPTDRYRLKSFDRLLGDLETEFPEVALKMLLLAGTRHSITKYLEAGSN